MRKMRYEMNIFIEALWQGAAQGGYFGGVVMGFIGAVVLGAVVIAAFILLAIILYNTLIG